MFPPGLFRIIPHQPSERSRKNFRSRVKLKSPCHNPPYNDFENRSRRGRSKRDHDGFFDNFAGFAGHGHDGLATGRRGTIGNSDRHSPMPPWIPHNLILNAIKLTNRTRSIRNAFPRIAWERAVHRRPRNSLIARQVRRKTASLDFRTPTGLAWQRGITASRHQRGLVPTLPRGNRRLAGTSVII